MRTQEIVETIFCDPCRVDGKQTIGQLTFALAINAGTRLRVEPRVVDVCEEHGAQYRALLNTMKTGVREPSASNGAKPHPPSSSAGNCPWCGKTMLSGSIATHVRDIHKENLSQPKQCPDCRKSIDAAQGMAAHRTKAHGYDPMVEYAKIVEKAKRKPSRAKS